MTQETLGLAALVSAVLVLRDNESRLSSYTDNETQLSEDVIQLIPAKSTTFVNGKDSWDTGAFLRK